VKNLLLLSLFTLLFSCSPKYLPLRSLSEPLNKWDYPDDLNSQHTIFEIAEGIQVRDYSIRIDLGNSTEVLVVRYDLDANSDSYKKIASDIFPNSKLKEGPKISLPKPSSTFLVDISKSKEINTKGVISIVPHFQKGLVAIAFSGSNFTKPEFVKEVITSIAYNGVPKNIIIDALPDSINFVDFKFKRNDYCHWMGPRNLACYPNGQMNWSIHSSLDLAKKAVDIQIQQTLSNDVKILRNDTINVKFVGKKTIARRLKLKVSYSALPFMSQSDILYTYYVAEEINGKYVHWVGSFFEDQVYPGNFAPLFYEVMKYDEARFHRLFCKKTIPSIDILEAIILRETGSEVMIKKKLIDESSYKIIISSIVFNKPLIFMVIKKKDSEKSLESANHFLEKISGFNEDEVSAISKHLEDTIEMVKIKSPNFTNEYKGRVYSIVTNYLLEHADGLEQIDQAGFYNSKQLLLRL
jgi:hypothetical protein